MLLRPLRLSSCFALLAAVSANAQSGGPAGSSQNLPPELEGVGISERLGAPVDLNLQFTGEDGYPVPLSKFFRQDRPVILNLVYYTCPMLCNLILNGQTAALREIPWMPGKEFEVVSVSIDPRENFEHARKKKAVYLSSYERPAPGWHFLTDYQGNAKRLAEEIGFHYRFDERRQEYAHASAIMVLTPDGRVSRYLYGVRYKPFDLRLALTEASQGRTGETIDRLLLFCFHYDPSAKSYVLFATNFMRGGGILTVLLMAYMLARFWRRERERSEMGANLDDHGGRQEERLVNAR